MNLDDDPSRIPDSPETAEPAPENAEAPVRDDFLAQPAPPPPQEFLPDDLRVPWSWLDLVVFLALCFAGAVGLVILFVVGVYLLGGGRAAAEKSMLESGVIDILFSVLLEILVLGFLAAQIRLEFRLPFWRTIGWRPLEIAGISRGSAYLGLIFVGLILDVIVTLASGISPPKQPLPIEALLQDRHTALLLILVAVLVAPVIEETVFRGFLYPLIARSWGIFAGVLITGLIFGGLHAPQLWGGPWEIAALVFVGIALTFVRAKTRTVVASFIVHTSYNFFQVLALLIGTHGLRNLPSLH